MNTVRLRSNARTFLAIAACLATCPASRAEEPPVVQELRARGNQLQVRNGDGVEDKDVSRDDEVRYLAFSEVKTLAPLSTHARNLTALRVIKIYCDADLSDLAELPNLQQLHLENFGHDLSPIAKLPHLRIVYLKNTKVRDYSPLAEVANLVYLNIHDEEFSDLSPLAKSTKLISLVVGGTKVSDLTPMAALVNLETFGAYGAPIRDLTPLTNLKSLYRLVLDSTQVSDLTPLAELTNLKQLWIGRRKFKSFRPWHV